MAKSMTAEPESDFKAKTGIDWAEVARLMLTSRAMDELEETRLVPEKKVLYQFSARGHDMVQVILGMHLRDGDAACGVCEDKVDQFAAPCLHDSDSHLIGRQRVRYGDLHRIVLRPSL